MKNIFRDKAKRRLGILETNLEFDSDIDDFTQEAVANLYPIIQAELEPEEFVLPANEYEISLADSDIVSVRKILIQNESGAWTSTDDYTMHKDVVSLYSSTSSPLNLRIEGSGRYNMSNVPPEFSQVVLYWVISEFYTILTGDKRKYNIYTQVTGARSVDNFRDLSDYYLDRGNQLLADRATIRGQ
ncbi:MAG: hypothetical protein DRQ44_17060 [Gammaproteobacteria bacterium]|nr:MAG: hypothetical protein DRQ44_17060 [Gammaproteobacteria bacterium]